MRVSILFVAFLMTSAAAQEDVHKRVHDDVARIKLGVQMYGANAIAFGIDLRDVKTAPFLTSVVLTAELFRGQKSLGTLTYSNSDWELPSLDRGGYYKLVFPHGLSQADRVTGSIDGQLASGLKADDFGLSFRSQAGGALNPSSPVITPKRRLRQDPVAPIAPDALAKAQQHLAAGRYRQAERILDQELRRLGESNPQAVADVLDTLAGVMDARARDYRRQAAQKRGADGHSTPVPLSPADGTVFGHFPRRTRLEWSAVPGAVAYDVEIAYSFGGTWTAYRPVRVQASWHEFDFVGAQPGRWRVTAFDAAGRAGTPCPWQNFRYTQ